MPERDEGRFTCPKCFQKYEVPPTTVEAIQQHLRERHGMKVNDKRWIRRRLKEMTNEHAAANAVSDAR